jgi:transcriptional regulator with XRE-family HTH domain
VLLFTWASTCNALDRVTADVTWAGDATHVLSQHGLLYANKQRSVSMTKTTFGTYIAEARKKMALSQKELAAKILRVEDQLPISPQYLNDIERDRRTPNGDQIISQFAKVLKVDADYLHYLAGSFPAELRAKHLSEVLVKSGMTAFRKSTPKRA